MSVRIGSLFLMNKTMLSESLSMTEDILMFQFSFARGVGGI